MSESRYVYPGTDVLINHAGIRNQAELDVYELGQTAIRAWELEHHPISGCLDMEHLQAIHFHLFQDVYPFAGQIRTTELRKGEQLFCEQRMIDRLQRHLFGELKADRFLQGVPQEPFVRKIEKSLIIFRN